MDFICSPLSPSTRDVSPRCRVSFLVIASNLNYNVSLPQADD